MGIFLHGYNNKKDLGYVERKLKISQYLEQKVCLQVRRISELLPYALCLKSRKDFCFSWNQYDIFGMAIDLADYSTNLRRNFTALSVKDNDPSCSFSPSQLSSTDCRNLGTE